MIKIVKDELTELMGSNAIGLNLESKPAVILMDYKVQEKQLLQEN